MSRISIMLLMLVVCSNRDLILCLLVLGLQITPFLIVGSCNPVCWIADFLTERSQCVKLQSIRSALVAISRSVVQSSRIGPYLYILLVRKLKTISFHNKIDKYADDTTLLVPQHCDISIETEFAHVQQWSLNKINW